MKQYTVVYEEGETSWGASVPDLPGCFAVGDTFEETEQFIREAIELYLEQLAADGLPIPEPSHRVGSVTVGV
jgi:predicted RNase H-like HicB family nuclease